MESIAMGHNFAHSGTRSVDGTAYTKGEWMERLSVTYHPPLEVALGSMETPDGGGWFLFAGTHSYHFRESMGTVVQELDAWVLDNYVIAASAVLWISDFMETLPAELQTIWSGKHTGTSFLFIVNRYSFLLSLLTSLIFNLPGESTDQECNIVSYISSLLQATSVVATSGLFALRIYAIYDNSCKILVAAALFIISRFALDLLCQVLGSGMSASGDIVQGFSRCEIGVTNMDLYATCESPAVQLSTKVHNAAFDAFIFGLTLRKTWHHALLMKRFGHFSIARLIVLDGSIYFLIMLVIGIISVIYDLVNLYTNANALSYWYIIIPFFNVLPNILISRLVLNLRTFNITSGPGDSNSTRMATGVSGLRFATNKFLGNIGAPLQSGAMEDVEE
ncbi:hypothetical protein D9757_006059 [Collybiopsis confluens]|uniref:DUF6533 domain-containing protein n=1 Tax=Collybiopsis confluens TaxID=2823264 RepID=A0A8H5HUS4_9AGAR|nr:hypothetical protein D9757_006059 [Collybiopsis confluens]